MYSSHLPGPHGYIIASKMSMFFLLFCWVAQFFSSEKRDKSILIESPVQLLNNSLPLFNNLFVCEPNSYQVVQEPNSYPIIRYFEPNSYQVFEPNSYPVICEPNSYPVICEPNSYPVICEPNSYQVFEPNSHFQNNSIQVLYETPLKNTSELSILYLLLGLQESSKNKTIQNNVERNFIIYQINSFLIFSI
jgi:hypothetical protein